MVFAAAAAAAGVGLVVLVAVVFVVAAVPAVAGQFEAPSVRQCLEVAAAVVDRHSLVFEQLVPALARGPAEAFAVGRPPRLAFVVLAVVVVAAAAAVRLLQHYWMAQELALAVAAIAAVAAPVAATASSPE